MRLCLPCPHTRYQCLVFVSTPYRSTPLYTERRVKGRWSPYEVFVSSSMARGKPSASVRWNLPCIQTRYILSCRLRFTSSRRSTPSCVTVNRGWASLSTSGPRRDGWITCTDPSSPLGAVGEGGSRLSGIGADATSSLAPQSPPSSSPSPFSSSSSLGAEDSWACCSWLCAAGGAGEPVNNNASSSVAQEEEGRRAESQLFSGLDARYAPSSKKYTRVLSPRI